MCSQIIKVYSIGSKHINESRVYIQLCMNVVFGASCSIVSACSYYINKWLNIMQELKGLRETNIDFNMIFF